MKHYLLKNEDERWALCWQYLQWKYSDGEVWRKEDVPLLESYFNWGNTLHDNKRMMTDEERKSFEHYKKCCKLYADHLSEIRDSVKHFDEDAILGSFGYQHGYDIEDKFDESDEKECYNNLSLNNKPTKDLLSLTYPIIAVVWIDSSFDRMGDTGVCCVDFVEKKEFEGV
jgi:hypothetical protein